MDRRRTKLKESQKEAIEQDIECKKPNTGLPINHEEATQNNPSLLIEQYKQ
jgi:hypothetical protein